MITPGEDAPPDNIRLSKKSAVLIVVALLVLGLVASLRMHSVWKAAALGS